jgi:hypothetical protein
VPLSYYEKCNGIKGGFFLAGGKILSIFDLKNMGPNFPENSKSPNFYDKFQ